MRDAWRDDEFANAWDGADHLVTNPDRINQIGLLVALLRRSYRNGDRILDLGIGSGLVEQALFRDVPNARVVGVDHSAAMLSLARQRLASQSPRIEFHEASFAALCDQPVVTGPFRFAICVQALHEVSHDEKQRIFAQVRQSLGDDGRFFVLDRFAYDAQNFTDEYRAIWQRMNRLAGIDRPMEFDDYHARYSRKTDDVAGVEDYLRWLRAAGFAAVCLYRQFNRALICARPARSIHASHRLHPPPD